MIELYVVLETLVTKDYNGRSTEVIGIYSTAKDAIAAKMDLINEYWALHQHEQVVDPYKDEMYSSFEGKDGRYIVEIEEHTLFKMREKSSEKFIILVESRDDMYKGHVKAVHPDKVVLIDYDIQKARKYNSYRYLRDVYIPKIEKLLPEAEVKIQQVYYFGHVLTARDDINERRWFI